MRVRRNKKGLRLDCELVRNHDAHLGNVENLSAEIRELLLMNQARLDDARSCLPYMVVAVALLQFHLGPE
jgi:hypothetical protein